MKAHKDTIEGKLDALIAEEKKKNHYLKILCEVHTMYANETCKFYGTKLQTLLEEIEK